MVLLIPDHIIAQTHMTHSEVLLEFAVFLYHQERVTLAQAAHLAGLERTEFQKVLAARQIPIHFNMEDLKQELNTIEQVKNAYRKRHLSH